MRFNDPVNSIKGIGPRSAERLERLGIYTAGDMLRHYPRDYCMYAKPLAPSDTANDDSGKEAAYMVRLNSPARHIRRGNMDIVTAAAGNGSGGLQIVWYHTPYIARQLRTAEDMIMYGRVVRRGSRRVLEHPAIIDRQQYRKLEGTLQPVYDLTEGLTQNFFRKVIRLALDETETGADYMPRDILDTYKLPELGFALRQIHFPDNAGNLRMAHRRLSFDEFFLFSLSLKLMGSQGSFEPNTYVIPETVDVGGFIDTLPYKLTSAQLRAFKEADEDMRSPRVMNRLIQGDVGSGKTVIAALLLMETAMAGYQGCLMAPTEVLAQQHYEKFVRFFDGTGIRCGLLTGSMSVAGKRQIYNEIMTHQIDIIIGTHALFQEKAVYDDLALIVTDEQHRFGVRQREMLADKSAGRPHVLVMSATPIPRTLAIVLYSDLDISVIDEKPARRLPVKNCVVGTEYRKAAYRLILNEVKNGHQAYIICPLVEASEGLEAENVTDYSAKLKKIFGDRCRVSALHGRMKPDEKNAVMKNFASGSIDVLVSTTVIEVGVDVPQATVMMIENSERFGLAQLHQLRGRVGRGSAQSYCIFMYGKEGAAGSKRLKIMEQSNDGFYIAAEDMKMRGPGDMFGTRQSGELAFRIADIFGDSKELEQAGEAASGLILRDPDLSDAEHAGLRVKLKDNMADEAVIL